MPEFMTMNGQHIAYEQDEAIAIRGLIAVAREYVNAGHHVVFIGDFRIESLDVVFQLLSGEPHQTLKLICSDDALLSQRVLEPTRPSGYRDVDASLQANRRFIAMDIPNCCVIDVARNSVDRVIDVVVHDILLPNGGMQP